MNGFMVTRLEDQNFEIVNCQRMLFRKSIDFIDFLKVF